MVGETIEQVILSSVAGISQKLRDENHTPTFTPDLADAHPGYMLDLYPYTGSAAITYLMEGLDTKRERWQGFGTDERQKKLDALVRAAQAPFRLLVKIYGFPIIPNRSMSSQQQLLYACEQAGLLLNPDNTPEIVEVFYYLQLASRGWDMKNNDIHPRVLKDALHAFEQVFFTL